MKVTDSYHQHSVRILLQVALMSGVNSHMPKYSVTTAGSTRVYHLVSLRAWLQLQSTLVPDSSRTSTIRVQMQQVDLYSLFYSKYSVVFCRPFHVT